jgi:hypothetical protein
VTGRYERQDLWSNSFPVAEGTTVYRFTGFFARPAIERPATLPIGAVWREVAVPFVGVGVRLLNLPHDEPGPDEARRLLIEVGLDGAGDWLFINYVTWAGPIDSVYGLGSSGGQAFGPVGETADDKVRTAYLELMGAFGVAPADAFNFPPFVRGYWGE